MSLIMKTIHMNAMIPGRPRRSIYSPPLPTPPMVVVVSKTMKVNTTSRRSVLSIPPVAAFLLVASASSSTSSSSDTSDPESAFVKETISSHNIVIFSKSYCPYCMTAKAVFKEMNQSPHIIELDERDDGMSLQDALSEMVGRHTVPQVFVNGKHIGGSDDTVEAYESGTLAKLLGVSKGDL